MKLLDAARSYRDSLSDEARFTLSFVCGISISLPATVILLGPYFDLLIFGFFPWWAWVGIDAVLIAVCFGIWKVSDWLIDGVPIYWDWF